MHFPSDIENKIVYFNPETQVYSDCSDLISLCYKCNNEILALSMEAMVLWKKMTNVLIIP